MSESTEESFAALYEQSLKTKRRSVKPGDKVSGKVVSVSAKRLVLDLGEGLDGLVEMVDLGEDPSTFHPGDPFSGFIIRFENRTAMVGRKLGRGAGNRQMLDQAIQSGVPVEGVVKEVNKGGYVLDISGVRGFCPLGQMALRRIEDPTQLIGKHLAFRVVEVREDKDVLLSRRALLEAEQIAKRQETLAKLHPGSHLSGEIVSIRDFGAFVDLGGIEGLIPASELSYGRRRPEDVVSVGQHVDVEVLRIETGKDGKDKVTLSMRALAADPVLQAVNEWPVGTILRGHVTRIESYGAFVELAAGVEGLLHISAFGKRVATVGEMVKSGDRIVVRLDSVDAGQRRLGLAFVDATQLESEIDTTNKPTTTLSAEILGRAKAAPTPEPGAATTATPAARPMSTVARPTVGQIHDVTVDKIENFGVFVSWPTGRGLVPKRELETQGRDIRRAFPAGSTFRAVITEVRPDGKMSLSKNQAENAEERAVAESFMSQQSASGLGTFGELLKKKLTK